MEKLLIGLHVGISTMLKAPEFQIDETEAAALRETMADLSAAYGWDLMKKVSAKTEATINAAIAVSIIYGPKIKAMSTRMKQEKARPAPVAFRPSNHGPQPVPRATAPEPVRGPAPAPRPAPIQSDPSPDMLAVMESDYGSD